MCGRGKQEVYLDEEKRCVGKAGCSQWGSRMEKMVLSSSGGPVSVHRPLCSTHPTHPYHTDTPHTGGKEGVSQWDKHFYLIV